MEKSDLENKWTYVSGFALGAQQFSVWVQPIRKSDGSFDMSSKVEETTWEQMKKDQEEHGIKYAYKEPE